MLPFQFADDHLSGGNGPDLLTGDAVAGIWQDTPSLILNPPEFDAGRPIPVGGSLLPNQTGGNDVLIGGADADILLGDAPSLILNSQGGDDRLVGGDGDDRLFGDAYAGFFDRPAEDHGELFPQSGISDFASGGDDDLDGGNGDDMLFGDALDIGGRRFGAGEEGNGGNDRLSGGDGNDLLFGEALGMFGSGTPATTSCSGRRQRHLYGEGRSALEWTGPAGNDQLFGGDGDDTLHGDWQSTAGSTGPAGENQLFGEEGDDVLHGGRGNDLLDGGAGSDIAAFDGNVDEFDIQTGREANQWTVARLATDETDTVVDVEFLEFDDVTLDTTLIA